MKKFSNPHIVSLLGKRKIVNLYYAMITIYVYTGISTGGSEGAPLMILEYMPYGDLHNFLLKHKLV